MARVYLLIGVALYALTSVSWATELEKMLFDDTSMKLSEAIKYTGKKQAIYSYIIANAATPEIDLAALLTPDDRAAFERLVPDGQDKMQVLLEFVMTRMGENTKRQNAYILLMKKKMDILRHVISKGQR